MFNWIWNRNNNGIITSNNMVANYCWCVRNFSRNYVAILLEKEVIFKMKVVVKKSPKFLRGFLKLIFGIKNT